MRRISAICFLLCIYTCLYAQLYVKAFTGYSFNLNPRTIQATSKVIVYEPYSYNENVYVSRLRNGQGINLGLSCGYILNKNISFELAGNTQIFTAQHFSIPQNNYNIWEASSFLYGYFGNIKYANSIFQLSPQFVYSIDYNNIKFYVKAGPNFLKVTNNIRLDYDSWNPETSDVTSYCEETKANSKFNIGIQSSFGTEFCLSKNINFFAEFLSVNTYCKLNESKVVKYDINGEDHLSDLSSETNSNDAIKIDFSHIGLNVGIKYTFNKR